jgi:hypothetical protein
MIRIAVLGKRGEKQQRKPKIKDKKQSERFKETARQVGADEASNSFDEILEAMAGPKPKPPKN